MSSHQLGNVQNYRQHQITVPPKKCFLQLDRSFILSQQDQKMFQSHTTLHSPLSSPYLLTTLLTTLVPRPLSDFILQLLLHSCEIKSGSGLGMRQPPDPITVAIPLITLAQTSPKRTSLSLSQMIVSLLPRPCPAFHHLQYDFVICARGEPGNEAK